MATLTISLSSTLITGNKTYTINEADVGRLINVMAAKFQGAAPSPLAPGAALLAWIQNYLIQPSIAEIKNKEMQVALATAESSNVPIVLT